MKTHVKKPCGGKIKCPFRKDCLKGWLGAERMRDITEAESFVCHKNNKLQCAGHLLVNKASNLYYRMAKAVGVDLKLKGEELVFDTPEDCIKHHNFNKQHNGKRSIY